VGEGGGFFGWVGGGGGGWFAGRAPSFDYSLSYTVMGTDNY